MSNGKNRGGEPVGSCCIGYACYDETIVNQEMCDKVGGTWNAGITCGGDNDPCNPVGACCVPLWSECWDTQKSLCDQHPNSIHYAGATCNSPGNSGDVGPCTNQGGEAYPILPHNSCPLPCKPIMKDWSDMSIPELREGYAGIYKLAPMRYIAESNCCPPFNPPTGSNPGWFTVSFPNSYLGATPKKQATYNMLGSSNSNIVIDCTESTKEYQEYPAYNQVYPNNPKTSGCGRKYHKPSGNSYRENLMSTGAPGLVTLYPVHPERSGADWATYRYDSIGNCIDCCYTRLSGLTYVEGSDATGDSLFNIKESAFCSEECYTPDSPTDITPPTSTEGQCELECVNILDDPHYYYVFFHQGWFPYE